VDRHLDLADQERPILVLRVLTLDATVEVKHLENQPLSDASGLSGSEDPPIGAQGL
jgi:hypothetical protein